MSVPELVLVKPVEPLMRPEPVKVYGLVASTTTVAGNKTAARLTVELAAPELSNRTLSPGWNENDVAPFFQSVLTPTSHELATPSPTQSRFVAGRVGGLIVTMIWLG